MQETPKALLVRKTEATGRLNKKLWVTLHGDLSLKNGGSGYVLENSSAFYIITQVILKHHFLYLNLHHFLYLNLYVQNKRPDFFSISRLYKDHLTYNQTELVNGALITWLHITCYVSFLWMLSLYLLWKRSVLTLIAGWEGNEMENRKFCFSREMNNKKWGYWRVL